METIQYLRALGRSWFIVVITLAAGGLGGYLVYHKATPMYRTSVRMVVSGSGNGQATDEVTARILATQRAQAIAQVAPTPPAVSAAATAAGYPGASPDVSATSDQNGPFVTVTVSDSRPARAQAIANAFTDTLVPTLIKLEGRLDTKISLASLAPAGLPTSPYAPNWRRDVGLGLAAGLVVGIAIALLREVVDRTVRDSDELERFTDAAILGTVPHDLPKVPLPASKKPRSARAEAYRQVRTTLLNAEGSARTLAITSATSGEGKTSVATNLAVVFSRAGHRVVIVDADLRRPRVAAVFGLGKGAGLSDVLAGAVPLEQAIAQLDEGRLAVLGSGPVPANPSEALGSPMMAQVLARLSAEYEYVIIDTPPVLPVTDALVVAPMVDGVVLVTRLGRITRERLRRALGGIARVNAELVGIVPNHAGRGADRDYRYGYRDTGSQKSAREIDADQHRRGTRRSSDPQRPPVDPNRAGADSHEPAAQSETTTQFPRIGDDERDAPGLPLFDQYQDRPAHRHQGG